ncbi:hypothetical protein GIB67_012643 [Kingdonia uniflora]|uniref:KIB1-4 beta-propeller domain-containing protein n=1 Tax=Kingdonia uniflora TaxID=39325 RepID=A0A7J7NEY0_9MAGN|nr:hypothetical protein GIB67_012643 [Kingdonia uniflora]
MIPGELAGGHEVHQFRMPVSKDSYCVSSCRGWLVIVERPDLGLHLFNPFVSDNNKIDLPPLTTFRSPESHGLSQDRFLQKVILSRDQTSTSIYAIMAIYYCRGNKVAFYKPGGKYGWTPLPEYNGAHDIIYFKDLFYVVLTNESVSAYTFRGSSPDFKDVISGRGLGWSFSKVYLVESFGEILRVIRFKILNEARNITVGFRVYKLNLGWSVEVKTLYGETLFLGNNSSTSFSSSHFPQYKPNCIYLADDTKHLHGTKGPHDLGVFELVKCNQIL